MFFRPKVHFCNLGAVYETMYSMLILTRFHSKYILFDYWLQKMNIMWLYNNEVLSKLHHLYEYFAFSKEHHLNIKERCW